MYKYFIETGKDYCMSYKCNSNTTVQCWHFKMWYFLLFFLYYKFIKCQPIILRCSKNQCLIEIALHSRKDIKFLSLVEDHPVFPKNVCKNLLFFCLTRPQFVPTIYHTRGEHANHYATDVVPYFYFLFIIFLIKICYCPSIYYLKTKINPKQ